MRNLNIVNLPVPIYLCLE